jgi:hypothetical protein
VLPRSGVVMAYKREAVGLVEDAYVEEKDVSRLLLRPTVFALLGHHVGTWKPALGEALECIHAAIAAWRERRTFAKAGHGSRSTSTEPFSIASAAAAGGGSWRLTSALMDHLHSFAGDLQMIRYLAKKPSRRTAKDPVSAPADKMPIEHMIDQHCAPRAVYFLDPQLVEQHAARNSKKVFGPVFRLWFDQLTGVNPRSREFAGEQDSVVRQLRSAQRQFLTYLLARSTAAVLPTYQLVQNAPPIVIEKQLDRGWLAAMVGSFTFQRNLIVTLKAQQPEIIMVRIKPATRSSSKTLDAKTLEVPEKRRNAAIEHVTRKLVAGVKIAANCPCLPLPELASATVFLIAPAVQRTASAVDGKSSSMDVDMKASRKRHRDECESKEDVAKYLIRLAGPDSKKINWEDFRHIRTSFPILRACNGESKYIKMETGRDNKQGKTKWVFWDQSTVCCVQINRRRAQRAG